MVPEGHGFIRFYIVEWNMGTIPYFAHKWNQTFPTKLRLAFVNIRNSAKVLNKNARARTNK